MFCFRFSNVYRVLAVLGLILAFICLIVPDVSVGVGMYLNVPLLAFLGFCAIFFSIINSWKTDILAFLVSGVFAWIYFIALHIDLFQSVDYSIWFACGICALPVIFASSNIPKGLLVSTNLAIFILIYDSIFWYKELQYIELNEINVLNLLASLYIMAIIIGFVRERFANRRVVIGRDYEKSI